MLKHLCTIATTPILIGTWADAHWAIKFYEKHGFSLLSKEEKDKIKRELNMSDLKDIESAMISAHDQYGVYPDDVKDDDGNTLLHIAITTGFYKGTKFLLGEEANANLLANNKDNIAPFDQSAVLAFTSPDHKLIFLECCTKALGISVLPRNPAKRGISARY